MSGRRVIAVAAVLAALAGMVPLRAGNPARSESRARILAGIEWGYDLTLLDIYHYDYNDVTDGFRVDVKDIKPLFYSNGHASAHVSLEFARHFALGLHAGYAGIQQRTRIYPVSLRSTYFFGSFAEDGNFVFLEGGAGVNDSRDTVSPFAKAGWGHRIRLTRRASMDMSAAVRCAGDHPPVYDFNNAGYVPAENLLRSDALYGAVVFAISLNF